DVLDLWQQLGHLGEAEGDALERGLAQVAPGRLEGEAVDRAARERVPAGAALAAEQGQERDAVLIGAALEHGALLAGERAVEPAVQVAAVRERTALDDAPGV